MTKTNKFTKLISAVLNKNSNWKSIVILLGITILFNILVFPSFYSKNQKNAILDTQFTYSPEKAYNILDKYNKEELNNYFVGELTIDLAYPIIYSLLLCLTIFKLSENEILSLVPLVALISDYFENFGVATIINYYPDTMPNIVKLASLFTTLKWSVVAASIVLILALLTKKNINKI